MDLRAKQVERARIRLASEDIKRRSPIIAKMKRDTVWFINNFGYTVDPRDATSPLKPFILFPIQEDLVRFMESNYLEGKWAILEKSRDVGATWILSAVLVKHWLFTPNFKGAVGSRKAHLVDKAGDPDCIFEKIRLFIRYLPEWLKPPGWDDKPSKTMLIHNPQNNATITGEAGDAVGRGGRSGLYFLDEAAFIERSSKVMSALSANTNCLIQVSTPNGLDNAFYKYVSEGNIPKFRIHWKDDPRKDHWITPDGLTGNGWNCPDKAIYPWYENKKKEIGDPVIIAQELDLDYSASVEGIYIPAKWVQTCINAHIKFPGIIDADEPITAGLDVAAGGANQTVLILRQCGLVSPKIYRWDNLDTTQVSFVVDELLRRLGVNYLCFDADGVGAGVGGTLKSIADKPYQVTPFNGASTEGMDLTVWHGENKTSKQKFANRRAEAWGIFRERVRKTYEMVEGITEYPEDELISLPNDPSLIMELSKLTIKYNSAGKILLQSKNELNRSPDTADAAIYAFVKPRAIAWWG
jgi:hypothetical protein